ncbi:TRAP transporter large permease [Caproiciproducens sp. NJN-50]|uniref:TRAP transporter large permease n=1 Tax=Acutalibacteraceae TaxID=3082771 RepID=UPI000FFE1DF7|nr:MULTISPECIES: TRAP transporter large permease [Acutalibacteraceae]QAT49122.1 TRAP transporter large permease [Caproiciproducens sp. NJN-50]
MLAIAFIIFFILLVLGVPIAFSMGLGSVIAIFNTGTINPVLVGHKLFSGVDSFSMMAIPFFMLSGELMESGGISKRIVDFAQSLVGHITGGLGLVDVLTSTIFAGISGSAAADTAAVGSMMIGPMKKRGYPAGLAAVIQASAGSLGPIIPPSLTMIIYCSLTNTSIGEVFMAGVIPGILIGLSLMFITYLYAKKYRIRSERRASFKEILHALKKASLALIMPLIIIGGIVGGVFTATEAGAVACVYAFIVGWLVYKGFKLKDIPRIVLNAASMTGMSLLIVAAASIFSWLVAYAKLPQMVISFLTSITRNPQMIMILLVLFLLFVGMFIETLSATIIVAPILFPVIAQYGINPIQFALVMIVVLVYAGVTPPVGGVLFITMGISKCKLKDTLPYLLPYLGAVLAVVLLCIFIPQISTALPGLIFSK